MQPILAESASRPGRAITFALALAVAASLVMISSHHRPNHREHHHVPRMGKCVQYSYVYLTR